MKLKYLVIGAMALTMASCSNDETPSVNPDGKGNVTITVSIPSGETTRGINDGLTANNLLFAVYDADNGNDSFVVSSQETFSTSPDGSLTAKIGLSLATGKKYNIAFFAAADGVFAWAGSADAADAVYVFDAENSKTLTVNYAKMTATGMAEDLYDCFSGLLATKMVGATNNNFSIELYRPIAQINWGTDDLDNPSINNGYAYGDKGQYIRSTLTTNAYNTLNLLTNDVNTTIPMVKVVLGPFPAPSEEGLQFPVTYPVKGTDGTVTQVPYDYAGMQYLLAPRVNPAIYNLSLDINNAGNPDPESDVLSNNIIDVPSAPVQANYQTNIYGNLLSDDVTILVTKQEIWNPDSYDEPYPQQ